MNSEIDLPKFGLEDKNDQKDSLHINPFWEVTLISAILVTANTISDFQINTSGGKQNVVLTAPFYNGFTSKSTLSISVFDEKGNNLIKKAEDVAMKTAYDHIKENLSFISKAKNVISILGITFGIFIISLSFYTNIPFSLSIPASLMGFSAILYKVSLKDD